METFAIWVCVLVLMGSILYWATIIIPAILLLLINGSGKVTIPFIWFIIPPLAYIGMVNCKGWKEFYFSGNYDEPTTIEKTITKTDTVYIRIPCLPLNK